MRKIAEMFTTFILYFGVSVLLSHLWGDVNIPESLLSAGVFSVLYPPLTRWITGKLPQKEDNKKDDEKE